MRSSLLLGLILMGTSVGCSVRVPTIPEQQKLSAMGAFPAGAPAWVSSEVVGANPAGQLSASAVPQVYGNPTPVAYDQRRSALARAAAETPSEAVAENVAGKEPVTQTTATSSDESPLNRISNLCPALNTQVREALTTTSRTVRIEKYEVLTKSCPLSSDLWFWLGKDYYAAENFPSAQRALEHVIAIDSGHTEATALLKSIHEKTKPKG